MSSPQAPVRRRRGRGMPSDELHVKYPSLRSLARDHGDRTREAWIAAFTARPDAMAGLLADLIKQVHAQPKRIGQRPMPREQEVDFHALVYGEDNDLPIAEVLPKIMRCSERQFASKLPMSRTQVQRMLDGEYEPDVNEIRHVAAAVGKSPMFFIEYRKAMAIAAFINLIDERPGIATILYKRYLEVRMEP